ncbi:alpha-1,4-glucan branching enzyme [Entomophthora muscae]|uniref:Alpha-1,4-glucan branching enzyme n=1 Tax=Entomophthora muscae TaxID=34485 RepID=A0ACC2TW11_9FUNG|nr:alpha-1,4-glucan branching enzyme [Entomophthora muscae]
MVSTSKPPSKAQVESIPPKAPKVPAPDALGLVKNDPWLEPYTDIILSRVKKVEEWTNKFFSGKGWF